MKSNQTEKKNIEQSSVRRSVVGRICGNTYYGNTSNTHDMFCSHNIATKETRNSSGDEIAKRDLMIYRPVREVWLP